MCSFMDEPSALAKTHLCSALILFLWCIDLFVATISYRIWQSAELDSLSHARSFPHSPCLLPSHPSLSLSINLCLYMSLFVCLSDCLSQPLFLFFSLSQLLALCLSYSRSFPRNVSRDSATASPPLCLCFFLFCSVLFCLSLFLFMFPCPLFTLSIAVCLPVFVCVSLLQSMYLPPNSSFSGD